MVPAQALGVGGVEYGKAHGVGQPPIGAEGELGVEGQARGQGVAGGLGGGPQLDQGRPGPLGIDMVGGDRRHATPVVDARCQQRSQVVGEIRRSLQVDAGWQHRPGDGDGPQELVGRARRDLVHRRARLGQEVLDDDLLDMAVASVAVGDGLEGVEPVAAGLADAHQQAGGEGDAGQPGGFESGQAPGRSLVRGRAVGIEIGADRLDHHALAGRDVAEGLELAEAQRTGVGMGKEAGLVEHRLACGHQVLDRGGEAVVAEPLFGHRVTVLGALAQGEEGLVTPRRPPRPSDVEDLVDGEVGRLDPGRCLGERAVAATVAAQHGQRDEHLGREGDPASVSRIPNLPGPLLQGDQIRSEQVVSARLIKGAGIRTPVSGAMVSRHRAPPYRRGSTRRPDTWRRADPGVRVYERSVSSAASGSTSHTTSSAATRAAGRF